ncbi:MAG: thioredoxin family protein [Coprobacillaceae bacterium]
MIKIFILEDCPHCKNARRWIEELYLEEPIYRDIEIEYIDEIKHSEIANTYDYYLVPSIYLDEKKVHEGVASKEIIENIFKQVKKIV